MGTTLTPSEVHAQFDAICAGLSDWEPLPIVVADPIEPEDDQYEDEHTAPVNELILAGLVLPY